MKALIVAITFTLCSFHCHAQLESDAPNSPVEHAIHKIRYPNHSDWRSLDARATEACVKYGITKAELRDRFVDRIRGPITGSHVDSRDTTWTSRSAVWYAMLLFPDDPVVDNAVREVMKSLIISDAQKASSYLSVIGKNGSIDLNEEIKGIYAAAASKTGNHYDREIEFIERQISHKKMVNVLIAASVIGVVAIILIYFVRRRRIKSKSLISVCIIIAVLISVGYFLQKHTAKLSQAGTVSPSGPARGSLMVW